MARETKVGLLAGLTFIICFAIILANRGRQNTILTEPPHLNHVDRSLVTRHDPRQQSASTTYQSVVAQVSDNLATPSIRAAGVNRSTPPRVGRRPAVVAGSRRPGVPTAGGEQSLRNTASPRTFRKSTVAAPDGAPEIPVVAAVAAPAQILQQHLDELSTKLAGRPRLQARRDPPPVTRPAGAEPTVPATRLGRVTTVLARHTVVPGDTLSGIAVVHYGHRAHRFVNAIFRANRAILSNPDELRVGMELTIPAVSNLADPPASPPASNSARPETGRKAGEPQAPEAKPTRLYQIKRDDRYVSIAREQLGDVRRWREIYELNKAVFPDPELIRAGASIELPARKAADARKGQP